MLLTPHSRAGLNECLKNILEGKYSEAIVGLSAFDWDETGRLLSRLANMLSELNEYTTDLSKGNLSAPFPGRDNYIAMGVKNLHSKLNHLVWQLKQVAEGDYTQAVDYMGELSERFGWMTRQLRFERERAEYEITHDKLTGMLTRPTFMRRVFDIIASDPDSAGIMLCCGLDNIKYVNDIYGYEAGNLCITGVAGIIGALDGHGSVTARISGDEFAIYMHGRCRQKEAKDFALKQMDMFTENAEIYLGGRRHKIRMSYGVSFYPADAVSVDILLKYAMYAMFEAKSCSGGEQPGFHDESCMRKAAFFEKYKRPDSPTGDNPSALCSGEPD